MPEKSMNTLDDAGTKTQPAISDMKTEAIVESTTVDKDEVAFFAKIADEWWNANGPFAPLHKLNPTRLTYIKNCLADHFSIEARYKPLSGLRILDIGCGGGLLCEPLTRLGATVVGVDASEKNIKVAAMHSAENGLTIDYRNDTAEALASAGEHFDAVINMEVIEHVADVGAFLTSCHKLLKPQGIMLVSTLNRTAKSLLFAKIGAEYILRWLPRGAHDWNKFITPHEMEDHLVGAGFTPQNPMGFSFNPLSGRWRLDDNDLKINYAYSAVAI